MLHFLFKSIFKEEFQQQNKLREGSPLESALGSARSSPWQDSEEDIPIQRNRSHERDGLDEEGGEAGNESRGGGGFRKRPGGGGGGGGGGGKSASKKMLSKSDRQRVKPKNRAGSAPYSTIGSETNMAANYNSHSNSNSNANFNIGEKDKDKDRGRDSSTVRAKARLRKVSDAQAAVVFGEKAATLGLYA